MGAFEDCLEDHFDVVGELYRNDPSLELIPMLFAVTVEGKVLSVSFPSSAWNEQRYEMLAEAASELATHKLLVVFLVSEAWMSQYQADEVLEEIPRPSQDPERKEIAMVVGMGVGGRTGCIQATIDRSDGSLKDVCRFPEDGGVFQSDLLEHFMASYIGAYVARLEAN